MEGDEFWYEEGDPAVKRFNTFDETWTNLAGFTGERLVPTMHTMRKKGAIWHIFLIFHVFPLFGIFS